MATNEAILKFNKVSFEYMENELLLSEVNFSIRRGSKTTVMGQNGAGKSTLFGLITKNINPESGSISIGKGVSVAISLQVIPKNELDLTVKAFFEKYLSNGSTKKIYNIDPKIDDVLEIVHLEASHDRIIKSFSGGQQARLLLASALIQNPDLLLLDEPTNNLDKEGIKHLTEFLIEYKKTCMVISHDADFLNSFTDGVLYIDVFTKKIEQYAGNYFDVQEKITIRQTRENRQNAQLSKEIQKNKDKASAFGNKGAGMRLLAKRMRAKAEKLSSEKVVTRKEDRAIRSFIIPSQKDTSGIIVHISEFKLIRKQKAIQRKANIELRRNEHLLISGPNGIGKSTLLKSIIENKAGDIKIDPSTRIGYYSQDFSTLNYNNTVYKSLSEVSEDQTEQNLRSVAAGFLITNDLMNSKIEDLSEGQKGLVTFARLVLQKPGLLILDEPTNHINFRHIPIIAEALNKYDGAMIIVSHVPEFIDKIRINNTLNLK